MSFLLDSHTLLWFISNDSKLSPSGKKILIDKNNVCFVSIASLWEIAIKHSIKRLELHSGLKEIFQRIKDSEFELLPISTEHILTLSALPHLHKDPFDRILIAQAKTEGLALVTKDQHFSKYDVKVFWN